MRTIHFNGEFWYENRDSALKRLLVWCCWLGGWGVWRDLRQDEWYREHQGGELRTFLHLITPISLFGHRFTLFGGAGHWWQLRIRGGYLVYTGKRYRGTHPSPALYWSPDGTPFAATTWFFGAPQNVRDEAAAHRRQYETTKRQHDRERAGMRARRRAS